MLQFFRERSLHTWIGTVGSIISIITYLTGIQTIYQIGSFSFGGLNFSWGQPPIGITIALLILNWVFVWGAFWVIATTMTAIANTSILFSRMAPIVFSGIGVAIAVWNFDAFFNIGALFGSFANGKELSFLTFAELLYLGPFMCLIVPIWIVRSANDTAEEWGCRQCGKIALETTKSYNTGMSEEKGYTKNERDEIQSIRVEKFQHYNVNRQCQKCGAEWIFSKQSSLGFIDYPVNDSPDEFD